MTNPLVVRGCPGAGYRHIEEHEITPAGDPAFLYNLELPGGGTWHEGYYRADFGGFLIPPRPDGGTELQATLKLDDPPPGQDWQDGEYKLNVTQAGGLAFSGYCEPWRVSFWITGGECTGCDVNQGGSSGGPGSGNGGDGSDPSGIPALRSEN